MKLPDFLMDSGLNGLRSLMGASLGSFAAAERKAALTLQEIETLTQQGIDVEWDAITVLPDGTLSYKGSRVILYIRDIASYAGAGQAASMPKFHVSDCTTLQKMRSRGRFQKYVVATREDGKFILNLVSDGVNHHTVTERLDVCRNCLDKLHWDGYDSHAERLFKARVVEEFTISRFFQTYGRSFVSVKADHHTALTAPVNVYGADFSGTAERLKQQRGFRCDRCRLDLSGHRRFLHAHHRNAQKQDSRPENIDVLCIGCHAEEFQHSHVKRTEDYKEFRRIFPHHTPSPLTAGPAQQERPVQQARTAPQPSWPEEAAMIARSYGLNIEDRRDEGGCLWVNTGSQIHPAARELARIGFEYSAKRAAHWKK